MRMRIYFEVLGGHTHVQIFTGPPMGKAGDITMTNEEFQSWKDNTIAVEFIAKENHGSEREDNAGGT